MNNSVGEPASEVSANVGDILALNGTLLYAKGRPIIQSKLRKQRVLYYYYLDPQLGRIHVRIETWFPFTVQIAVNGHEWLARQLQNNKLGFCLMI